MISSSFKKWGTIVVAIILAISGVIFWLQYHQPGLPEGFASGNGRIEATEVDIMAKFSGRLAQVLVNEGDTVKAGQILARIDTENLDALSRQAQAQIGQAQQERNYAAAVIEQRKSELALVEKELDRSRELYERDNISLKELQRDETAVMTAKSALAATRAKFAETGAAIEAAVAASEKIKVDINDSILRTPVGGRILYRLHEPGEILAAGRKLLTVLDLSDVYMTIFLPTAQAGRVTIGAEARIVLDALPDVSIPARVSFVAPEAQFTPRAVETRTEREKLMFRIKVKIDQELLKSYAEQVKTGLPGVAYVRLSADAHWPESLPALLQVNSEHE
ncbi:HlyD family secretion protein [Desulfuromusa kysingii]|uniref:HlyD family secretion protein n=1 Tax=Desulfuromusa kysingii TaxID=37625 RepID=A0A1H3ZTH4_9BACT|nr:HlyD family efflux transporter periplasmic adaptor subunit [Desulfuromusa kysingii]SEA26999.1 HlyD family secretion protein [Desulfuromusa kysingii]